MSETNICKLCGNKDDNDILSVSPGMNVCSNCFQKIVKYVKSAGTNKTTTETTTKKDSKHELESLHHIGKNDYCGTCKCGQSWQHKSLDQFWKEYKEHKEKSKGGRA